MSVENELYEVMKFSDGPRSWFIDNTLQTGVYVLCCFVVYTSHRVHTSLILMMS